MKIGILTSGGDAPGMNAAIRGVVRTAQKNNIEVVGIIDGYKGVMEENFVPLTGTSVSETIGKGGTFLGSARYKEFKKDEVMDEAAAILNRNGISALVVIGGDGTYKGALGLTKRGIACIGIPGTIDNDAPGTDFTIGFDTALHTAVESVDKLRDTSSSHHRCSVVEVMGNHCGDLAMWTAIACGAEMVVTPETGFEEERIISSLKNLESKKHAIVVVAEKLCDVNELAEKITSNTSFAGRATILGYVQRGGSPSPKDRVLASQMAEKAVEEIIAGHGGLCIGIVDNKIIATPIEEAMLAPKKSKEDMTKLFNSLKSYN